VKIAFLLTGPNGGGAERAMINVANYLARNSHHHVLLFLGSADGAMRDAIDSKVRIVDLGARRARSMLVPLAAHVRSERPDVLVSGLMICDFISLLGRRIWRWPVKIVISVQSHPLARASGSTHGIQRYWPVLIRLLYRRADSVVGISSGVARTVAELLGRPHESVPVIPNPVISPGFREKLEEEPDHPWFHDGGPPVLLAAGRFTEAKDYPTLLRAFAKLTRRREARLIVIGEGEERAALERLIQELGVADRVAMPGFVANPYAWMKRARLFVLSSRWEGFGNVLAEALACGTPVVATDCPSGPVDILDGGAYGQLVAVGDVEALARAIEEALDARVDSNELIARGMQFSVERIAPRYLDLIESVVAR
jgi:glycosyltransferase involved in cell wall biosynthesis